MFVLVTARQVLQQIRIKELLLEMVVIQDLVFIMPLAEVAEVRDYVMVLDVDGDNQLEVVDLEVVVATLMSDQKLFQDKVYQIKDLMVDGVEIILQEHQTMLLEEVVEQVVQEEIIVKDLLVE